MVRLNLVRLGRTPNPDRWWKRKFVFDQTQHFYGRRRNCYRVAIIALRKAWKSMQKSRIERRGVMSRLWNMRIGAATVEHGMRYSEFIANLPKHNILLDRKILSMLAITEPKTFKCLVDLARVKKEEASYEYFKEHPELLERMTTQEDLLSEAMKKLKVDQSGQNLTDQQKLHQSQTGKETAV